MKNRRGEIASEKSRNDARRSEEEERCERERRQEEERRERERREEEERREKERWKEEAEEAKRQMYMEMGKEIYRTEQAQKRLEHQRGD